MPYYIINKDIWEKDEELWNNAKQLTNVNNEAALKINRKNSNSLSRKWFVPNMYASRSFSRKKFLKLYLYLHRNNVSFDELFVHVLIL